MSERTKHDLAHVPKPSGIWDHFSDVLKRAKLIWVHVSAKTGITFLSKRRMVCPCCEGETRHHRPHIIKIVTTSPPWSLPLTPLWGYRWEDCRCFCFLSLFVQFLCLCPLGGPSFHSHFILILFIHSSGWKLWSLWGILHNLMYFPLGVKIIGCLPTILQTHLIGKCTEVVNHFSLMFHEPLFFFVPTLEFPTCIHADTQGEKWNWKDSRTVRSGVPPTVGHAWVD